MRGSVKEVQKIETLSLSIDGHQIPVPAGLSELLQNCWSPRKTEEPEMMANYERSVYRDKNGTLVSEYRLIEGEAHK